MTDEEKLKKIYETIKDMNTDEYSYDNLEAFLSICEEVMEK